MSTELMSLKWFNLDDMFRYWCSKDWAFFKKIFFKIIERQLILIWSATIISVVYIKKLSLLH